jgi:hypothetical protein
LKLSNWFNTYFNTYIYIARILFSFLHLLSISYSNLNFKSVAGTLDWSVTSSQYIYLQLPTIATANHKTFPKNLFTSKFTLSRSQSLTQYFVKKGSFGLITSLHFYSESNAHNTFKSIPISILALYTFYTSRFLCLGHTTQAYRELLSSAKGPSVSQFT